MTVGRSTVGSLALHFGHMLKAFIGANYLSIPYAVKCAGAGVGAIGLIVIGVLTGYCCLLLVECKRAFQSRPGVSGSATYSDLAGSVYGARGRMVVDVAVVVTQVGFCVGYFIFVSSNLGAIMESASLGASSSNSSWVYILMMMPIVMVLSLVQDISKLVPFSLVADGVLLFGFVVIFARVLDQLAYAPPPPGDVVLANWSSFALFFGVVVSGFEGIALILPMETSMGLPVVTFRRLLVLSIVVVSAVFVVFGVVGYMSFASATEDVLTLNLEASPLLNVVTLAILVGVVFTYPLQLFPAVDIVARWTGLQDSHERKVVSTGLVVLTAITAWIMPSFGLLLSLIGNLGSATLSFILPTLIHIHMFRKGSNTLRYAVFAFGVTGGVLGTVVSLHAIFVEVFGFGGHSAVSHV